MQRVVVMQSLSSLPHFGERWRVFWVGMTLAIWLFIVDGLNFTYNWDNHHDEIETWAKTVVIIAAYTFFACVTLGSFMLLGWMVPNISTVMIMFGAGVCGVLRLIATLAGFRDFWQKSYLDSVNSGTTDVAIFALQIYLLMDAFYLYRVSESPPGGAYQPLYGAQPVMQPAVVQASPPMGAVVV